MMRTSEPDARGCIFCAIACGQGEASVVHRDENVVAFMDRYPATPGHVLVIPREHVVGLEDLDGPTGAHVWSVAQDIARALRRSTIRCEGINLLVCDGEAAFQSVFHLHLHVIPRYPDDGWSLGPQALVRDRPALDGDAQEIKNVLHPVAEGAPTFTDPR